MKLYTIIHKETGLTLRQFAKKNLVPVHTSAASKSVMELSLNSEKLNYMVSQKGCPGFYYHAWPNQFGMYWLDTKLFEVQWKGGFCPSPNFSRWEKLKIAEGAGHLNDEERVELRKLEKQRVEEGKPPLIDIAEKIVSLQETEENASDTGHSGGDEP